MSEFPFRSCEKCKELLPIRQFPVANGYRRRTCRMCIRMGGKLAQVTAENRQFNALVRWSPPPLVERHGTGISE